MPVQKPSGETARPVAGSPPLSDERRTVTARWQNPNEQASSPDHLPDKPSTNLTFPALFLRIENR